MSDKFSFNRRQVVAMGTTMTAGALAGCVAEGGGVQQVALGYKPVPQLGTPNNEAFPVPAVDMRKLPTQFHRQYVRHNQKYKKDTIIVDTASAAVAPASPGAAAPRSAAMRCGHGGPRRRR